MTLETELATAQSAHTDATTRLRTVTGRLDAALAAKVEAEGARTRLVADASTGTEIAPKALRNAETDLLAAQSEARLWTEARAGAEAAVTEAAAAVHAVQRKIRDRQFAAACHRRLEAARRLQSFADEFGKAYAAWMETADDIFANWPLGTSPGAHQIEALREHRRGAWACPREIQNIIVSGGSANVFNLLTWETGNWGAEAAKHETGAV